MARRARSAVAGTLDTAVLVFLVLLVGVVAWKVLAAVVGTLVFLAKLFMVAVAVAAAARLYLWARGRRPVRPPPGA